MEDSDSLKKHLLLAREHYEKREYDRAEPHLNAVLKLADDYADVHNMLGVIHHDRGDFQEARKHFESATRINPNYTEAALNLAVTYNDLALYQEARAVYESMLRRSATGPRQIDPFSRGKLANLHAEVAQAYADFGLWPEAAAEYRKALWLCPNFADLRTRLANVLRDMGDLDAAVHEYEDALGYNPRYLQARVALGVTLLSLGNKKRAIDEWEKVLEVEPTNRSAQMYLRMARGSALKSQPPRRPSVSDLQSITLAEPSSQALAPAPVPADLDPEKK